MEAIAKLELEYFRLRFGYGSGEACVDWQVNACNTIKRVMTLK